MQCRNHGVRLVGYASVGRTLEGTPDKDAGASDNFGSRVDITHNNDMAFSGDFFPRAYRPPFEVQGRLWIRRGGSVASTGGNGEAGPGCRQQR